MIDLRMRGLDWGGIHPLTIRTHPQVPERVDW